MLAGAVPLGKLRHRVAIQAVTRTQAANGEVSEAWADVATVWAFVEPVTSREIYAAQQAQVSVTHRVTLRYRSDLTVTGHRLAFNGRYLAISGLRNVEERNSWLQVDCLEWSE